MNSSVAHSMVLIDESAEQQLKLGAESARKRKVIYESISSC